ncbi:hypothetical protein CHIBA101_1302 [Actinomyces sp. Chiba101]|nr:hypothetical protein CHIBA101_1302 [Actinomyces sp. Chiba101]GAV95606.1 hypothetical protein ADENT20671_2405 [Actinomyces denticolens]
MVMASLVVVRHLRDATGMAIKKIIQQTRRRTQDDPPPTGGTGRVWAIVEVLDIMVSLEQPHDHPGPRSRPTRDAPPHPGYPLKPGEPEGQPKPFGGLVSSNRPWLVSSIQRLTDIL